MSEQLNKKWVETTIDEVTVNTTQRQPLQDESFVYIDIGSIDRDTKRISTPQRMLGQNAPSRARKVVQTGDVIVSTTRPNLNAVAMVPEEFNNQIASTGFDVLRAPSIDPRWLFYIVRTTDFVQAMSELVKGALYPAVRPRDIRSFRILLAPLDEQKRIADKLDRLITKIDACRERCDRIPPILQRFRQSVLAAATSGELTEDWRAEQQISSDWQTVRLSEVATSRLGKMLDKAKNQGIPTPYLRNINVRWFGFDLTDIQEIRVTEDETTNLFVHQGDVLICEGGEPGRCAIWQGADNIYVYQKALHRVRVGTGLTPEWLCYCLKNAADSGQLAELFTGTTIKHLTAISLSRFEFILPPIDEQHEIIRRVESLFAYADRLESRYQTARAQVDRLTPTLLDKAFLGELIPQDPNDEPASVLLEQIRRERAVVEANKTKQKQRTTVASTPSIFQVAMLTQKDIQPSHLSSILKVRGSLTAENLCSENTLVARY